jgi:hypothetical protein
LAGEQSDTLGLLRLNDRKSRHRRIKKQRRYERLAATSQLSGMALTSKRTNPDKVDASPALNLLPVRILKPCSLFVI